MHYIFPFEKVKKDEDIILYGAGVVGQEFYAQICATEYCNIVAWVDKEFEFYQSNGLHVVAFTEEIKRASFDHIVIAVADRKVASEMVESLSGDFSKEMIIWQKYVNGEPKNGIIKKIKRSVKEYNPKLLVSSDTLDIVIRYLLCQDIINGIENKDHLELYMKYMLIINNLRSKGVGDLQVKIGSDEFLESFGELVRSMQKDGFYKTNPILVDSQNKVINGRHRLASALAMEEKIWASRYLEVSANIRNCKWFYDNGFSVEELQSVLYGFTEVYKKCNIILYFGTIKKSWDFITKQFEKTFKIVGYIDLDFRNDYIGFENLIHDIYNDVLWDDPYKDRKLRLLKLAPLEIRVVLISDEFNTDVDIYKDTSVIKKMLRNNFVLELGERKANISLHAGDSEHEFIRLRNILLSSNNLWHNSVRVLRRYDRKFINKLDQIKEYLRVINVPMDAICIVGSAGLEVYGLREARDVDLIVKRSYYNKILETIDQMPKGTELVRDNSMALNDKEILNNDVIINNENLHYIFNELKFLNLKILKERYEYKAKKRNDGKAYEDSNLLDIFFEYARWFDDRKTLQRQLELETNRNRWTV